MSTHKIAFVVDDTMDKPDGVQQYVLTVGAELTRRGHTVEYLAGESTRNDITVRSLAKNVNVKFNGNGLSIPFFASQKSLTAALSRNYDVLHVQMPYHPLLAGSLVKACNSHTAVVGTFHILPFRKLEAVATRLLGKLLRPSLQRFDHLFAVSEPARVFAEQSFGGRYEVLPNAIDIASFANKPKKAAKLHIVFLGRLVERKGAMKLLEALQLLDSELLKTITVTFAGKGPLETRLKAAARGVGCDIHFSGFVAEADKPALLGSADIAIFPATGGESFGIVLLEAMASKAGVVLAGDNPGYASVLGDLPECLFNPADSGQIARKLQQFIADKSLRDELHAQQQTLVTRFDVRHVVDRLEAVYDATIAKRSS